MKRTAFQLRVVPLRDGKYGVALDEVVTGAPRRRARDDDAVVPVVRVWGLPMESVLDRVIAAVKRSGGRASDLNAKRTEPFPLDEETGVRLGLLLLAVKPLRKSARIDAIRGAIDAMGSEEAYYWFSKCISQDHARRSQRAFRVLLAS